MIFGSSSRISRACRRPASPFVHTRMGGVPRARSTALGDAHGQDAAARLGKPSRPRSSNTTSFGDGTKAANLHTRQLTNSVPWPTSPRGSCGRPGTGPAARRCFGVFCCPRSRCLPTPLHQSAILAQEKRARRAIPATGTDPETSTSGSAWKRRCFDSGQHPQQTDSPTLVPSKSALRILGARPLSKSLIWRNGPGPLEVGTLKGHADVKVSDATGTRAPDLEFLSLKWTTRADRGPTNAARSMRVASARVAVILAAGFAPRNRKARPETSLSGTRTLPRRVSQPLNKSEKL